VQAYASAHGLEDVKAASEGIRIVNGKIYYAPYEVSSGKYSGDNYVVSTSKISQNEIDMMTAEGYEINKDYTIEENGHVLKLNQNKYVVLDGEPIFINNGRPRTDGSTFTIGQHPFNQIQKEKNGYYSAKYTPDNGSPSYSVKVKI